MQRPSGVSSASEASCAASASSAVPTPGAGMKRDGQPVAERDRAGLVEQQHVDVAGGLDRAAGSRDHVGLDHAVHAGDADRREQSADRGRNQADQQRHQHGDRDRRALAGDGDAVERERQQRRGRLEEDQRQAGEQDRQRDLVRACAGAWRSRPSRSCDRERPRRDWR